MDLRKRRLILGGIFFALMFFYHGTTLYFQSVQVGSYIGWRGKSDDGKHFYTTTPDLFSPTALVQRGDELIAVNGIHPAEDHRVLELSDRSPVGTPFTMRFSRNGQLFSIVGQTVAYPPGKYPYATKDRLTETLIWLVFLLTGLALLLLKPENRQAWLLALMLCCFTGVMTNTYPYSYFGFALECLVALPKIAAVWFFPLFPLFFLNFPERSRLLLRFPRLERWIYWSNYFLLLPLWLGFRLPSAWRAAYINLPVLRVLYGWESRFKLSISVVAIYLTTGFFFIGYNYWHACQDARRRMRVAILGSIPGFIALLLFVLNNFEIVRKLPHWTTVIEWAQWLLYFVLPLIPVSFAYAIIRHKVIPVSLIIKQGLRYLLVRRGATILIIVVLWLLVTRVLSSVFFHWRPSGLTIGWFSSLVTILMMRLTKVLNDGVFGPLIDRKFFRQAYDAQQLIAELNDILRTVTDQKQLLEQVATRIQSALQSTNVAIFLKESPTSENFACQIICECDAITKQVMIKHSDSLEGNALPTRGQLLAQAADNELPLEIEEELDSSAPIPSDLLAESDTNDEVNTLRHVTASLLLPLKSKEGLIGAITVGQRLGGLPYFTEDKRLLLSVAAPTTFALENSYLVAQMIAEARRREEIEAENAQRAKELEEARQLQLSMLPKSLPDLPHVEVAAFMKTATEVGGDYYDYALIQTKNREDILILAIGDATGHGLKAGTVVTATKSLFNAHAQNENLADTFSLFTRSLKQMNMRAMYMALSLIRLDGNQLKIASAGMPPLLLYRASTGQVEEHLLKGVPLGSIKKYPYIEFQFAFEPGDWLVLMSDGLPERFNESGDMLGYEPLKQLLTRATQSASPQDLIDEMLRFGDDWAGNRPLDDDITLLVLKAKS